MSERTFRVMVRGSFDALTDDQRVALLADAAEHDVLSAASIKGIEPGGGRFASPPPIG